MLIKKKNIIFIFSLLSLFIFSGCSEEETGTIIDHTIPHTNAYESISTGYEHSCGIDNFTAVGTLKCWGRNYYGQLGTGNQVDSLTALTIDAQTSYTKVSVGAEHSCGLTMSHLIKCWGRNNFGQLGTGDNTDSLIPLVIDNTVLYLDISVSGKTTCAITQSGQLKCWGYNGFGGLGDGTTINRNTPIAIDVSTTYKSISVGDLYACGITTANALKCWGHNLFNELGDGTTVNRFLPVVIDTGTTYQKISTSKITSYHTCGITTAGVLKCWGDNQYGQLGDGTFTKHSLPTIINAGKSYSEVSVGYVHTCAVEKTDGTLFCWGTNDFGQLGDYTVLQNLNAVEADTGNKFVVLSAGYNYTCGVTTLGYLRCFGRNNQGQIGDGTTNDVLSPKVIN